MEEKDIRWRQRSYNYSKALSQLQLFIEQGELNKLEKQGLIKAFEYTYELAWNTIKDFYEYQGEAGIQGSRDSIKLAFKRGLILDEEIWGGMLNDRNRTSHTYNEEIANEIIENIIHKYFIPLLKLKEDLGNIK